jgi:mono/diheme cytochrome c family protein
MAAAREVMRFDTESLTTTTQRPGPIGGTALVLAAIASALTACHSTPPLTAQEAEGQHLYEVRCAHCHEDNDLALKKVPPDLHGVFRRSTLPSGVPATDQAVKEVVLSGKGLMPSFAGRFTDEQMAALMAYLHTGLR